MVVCDPFLCVPRSVLRVIALHEFVTPGEGLSNEGEQCLVKDLCVQFFLHYPLENANASPAFQTDSSPHVDLCGVLVHRGERGDKQ